MSLRIGSGYDSHRFESGRPLVLGGVRIEHDRGLAGHSDADVLIHALIDAILGACGEGDIGTHFPPSDERWRDSDSSDLLRATLGEICAGAELVNADLTLVAEEPKLGPHRGRIEATLSELTGAPVSVKATTNEGMGWIGRGEGVAAIAVALVDVGG
ncbi:2-C-methyl-D-erythritol 2,4-cyclodiphosphate synthase [Thermoleophilia bacterium SCSIO 60948]|nr:2-C-methyl-D-erythritol 2,4-cyclodiphosphate synthase [Thermoleophilia bacterium SCSIO 60948]